ncbi:hypothetical protein K502DRAFT_348603 [Neoconidiobolus thromboides FSU 785]|nr:hypothetical protein K502DRAFT_348603 [Neoconidiobolus thromboides FSU 785]
MNPNDDTVASRFNPHRCDQCTKRHIKCDRLLPGCSNCKLKKITCTYLIIHKEKKQLLHLETNLYSFKLNTKVNKPSEDKPSKVFKFKDGLSYQPNYKSITTIQFPSQVFSKVIKKHNFENLRCLLQFPIMSEKSQELSLLIILAEKYGIFKKSTNKLHLFSLTLPLPVSSSNVLLTQAYELYHSTCNTVFPLFNDSKLEFNTYSSTLKAAIFLNGLLRMEESTQRNSLVDYFKSKLIQKFKFPHRIPPTLENIQAIFILLLSPTSVYWISNFVDIYIEYCIKAATCVGLHFNRKLNWKLDVQRIMLYCSLMIYYTLLRLSYGTNLIQPYVLINLRRHVKKFIHNIRDKKKLEFNGDDNFNLNCKLTFCLYYNEVCFILLDLNKLKQKFINQSISSEKLSYINFILTKTKQIQLTHITIFEDIKRKSINSSIPLYYYQLRIQFLSHYISFFTLSLLFYNSNTHLNDTTNPTSHLTKALAECEVFLSYGVQLSSKYLTSGDVALISQGIVFYLRYQQEVSNEKEGDKEGDKGIVMETFNYFKKIGKKGSFVTDVNNNLKIINFIHKAVKREFVF